jgi:hypothetical protein
MASFLVPQFRSAVRFEWGHFPLLVIACAAVWLLFMTIRQSGSRKYGVTGERLAGLPEGPPVAQGGRITGKRRARYATACLLFPEAASWKSIWKTSVFFSLTGARITRNLLKYGGGRGIRTPVRVSPQTVFKTAGFNHSPIPPFSILPDFTVTARFRTTHWGATFFQMLKP